MNTSSYESSQQADATASNSSVAFDNTQIAFAHRSHADLRRAWLLFRMLGKPQLVRIGKPLTSLAFQFGLPIKPLIRETLFKQFVGGETIAECEKTIQELANYQIGSILDYSAEGKDDENSFEQTTQELIAILDRSASDRRIPFAVFKPTGLASAELLAKASQWQNLTPDETQALNRFKQRVEKICSHAVKVQTPVLVDAEESWLQGICDQVVLDMMMRFNQGRAWVWNTLQMYRTDRLAYLKDLIEIAQKKQFHLGFKLVRGAYMEKEREQALKQGITSPIQPCKADTDRAFDQALELCLKHIDRVSICSGSHNETSNYLLIDLMRSQGLAKNDARIWFAQLLGMSDHISFNLSAAGFNVVKYVPYAPIRDLMPYLMRRAEENTSVAGQSSRELDLLQAEMKRRRLL